MDPIIGSALIGAGSSLLGGLFGSKKKSEYVVPDYQQIRNKAEAAGFNPLTALTSAPGSVVASQNYMGSAIADAGIILADGLAKRGEKVGELQRLKEENEKLVQKVQQATIRPKVGGIYAGNHVTPTLKAAVGGSNGQASSSGLAGPDGSGVRGSGVNRPLREIDPVDPRRAVDNIPVNSSSGVMVVDNPHAPRFYVPSLDGDEPLDILELPVVAGSMGASYLWDYGDKLAAGGSYIRYPRSPVYKEPAGPSAPRGRSRETPYINYPGGFRPDPYVGAR